MPQVYAKKPGMCLLSSAANSQPSPTYITRRAKKVILVVVGLGVLHVCIAIAFAFDS